MDNFKLAAPSDLRCAVGSQLDRWAFLYGKVRAESVSAPFVIESDDHLRARLMAIAGLGSTDV